MARLNQFKLSPSEKIKRRFSDNFKLQKVREIELGKTKVSEICKQYQVSAGAVYKWLNKFGMGDKKTERLIVESDSDTRSLLAYKQKVAELERLIGQKQILIDFQDKMIEIAESTYGISIKKKPSTTPSNSSGNIEKNTPSV
jgi:transposase